MAAIARHDSGGDNVRPARCWIARRITLGDHGEQCQRARTASGRRRSHAVRSGCVEEGRIHCDASRRAARVIECDDVETGIAVANDIATVSRPRRDTRDRPQWQL